MKADRKVVEAAARMNTLELAPFVVYLRETRAEYLELLTTAPESHLLILQGKAQAVTQILDVIDTALDKLRAY